MLLLGTIGLAAFVSPVLAFVTVPWRLETIEDDFDTTGFGSTGFDDVAVGMLGVATLVFDFEGSWFDCRRGGWGPGGLECSS